MSEASVHVIDTNVLLVASAAEDRSVQGRQLTPIEEPELRYQVLEWLVAFQFGERQLVLDVGWKIPGEYQNNLHDQDYGWQVTKDKMDQNRVSWVNVDYDENGHAVLLEPLQVGIHDREDRKMVAAVLAAGGRAAGVNLVNACDTDWYDCEACLRDAGVDIRQLLPDWCHAKWRSKQRR